jgi:hypothetical protein
MSSKLNRAAYERLIAEDIAELEKYPRTLERDHAIHCVRDSLITHYDTIPKLQQLLSEVIRWHTDKGSSRYAECELTPCDWCKRARELLDQGQ